MRLRDQVRALPRCFWLGFLLVATPVVFALNFGFCIINHGAGEALIQAAVNTAGWAVATLLVTVLLRVDRGRES